MSDNDDSHSETAGQEWEDCFDFDRFSEGDDDPFDDVYDGDGGTGASVDPFYDSDHDNFDAASYGSPSSSASSSSSSSPSSSSSSLSGRATSPSRDLRMNANVVGGKLRQHNVARLAGSVDFLVLEEGEVRELCNQALNHVIEFYPVSRIRALQLLKQNKWDYEKVINLLVDSGAATQHELPRDTKKQKRARNNGAASSSSSSSSSSASLSGQLQRRHVDDDVEDDDDGPTFSCLICFETRSTANGWAPACGHMYCRACWADYFNVAIRDGDMFIECMCPPCKELIDGVEIMRFVSARMFNLYQRIFYRQFVADHPRMKWCPAPGCERAIELLGSVPARAADGEEHPIPVRCGCGLRFCFRCTDPEVGDHTPATCQEVEHWMEKVSKEAENVSWIIANTKRCPKCRSPIEKNGGCMHMTCLESHGGCGHQWCWLCRGPWSEHGSATGGFYSCNKYDASAAKTQDLRKQDARTDLERYMFYYHRYESHRNAGRVASDQLKVAETTGFHFQERFNVRAADTRFLQDATQQLVDSRRSLQWSYVYGYYLKMRSAGVSTECNLFEYLQEDLEKFTNELSNSYERHEAIRSYDEFTRWKERITNYTRVTAKFFQNFVTGIQQGLTSAPASRE